MTSLRGQEPNHQGRVENLSYANILAKNKAATKMRHNHPTDGRKTLTLRLNLELIHRRQTFN